MAIQLMLASVLRKYVPEYNAETGLEVQIEAGCSIRELVRRLSIPLEEVKLIMVDGVSAEWETILEGDERVALFPPIGGG